MKTTKLTQSLLVLTTFVGMSLTTTMAIAAPKIPSSSPADETMTIKTFDIDGLQLELKYNEPKCAQKQLDAVREAAKLYEFRKTLDRVGVTHLKVLVNEQIGQKPSKAGFSEENTAFYVKSYPALTRAPGTPRTVRYASYNGPDYEKTVTDLVNYSEGCQTYETKDLIRYMTQVKEYLDTGVYKAPSSKAEAPAGSPAARVVNDGVK